MGWGSAYSLFNTIADALIEGLKEVKRIFGV